MARRDVSYGGQFIGLDLNNSEYTVPPTHAIVADNVFTESGRVETRPGRLELAEDQGTVKEVIGIHPYASPEESLRSLVLVRTDGIYVRTG